MVAVEDYDKTKALEVTSASGTPTISRALAIKLVGGDDSATGTGEVAIDWSGISGPEDVAVFDEGGNLLDYHIEAFDASNQRATIWTYRDWVRDGTVQAQIAYGNGSSDQSVDAPTVFGKESGLAGGYLFNESSGNLLDISGNNNDGGVYGATQGAAGIVGGAYSFDGSDDYVEIPSPSFLNLMDGSSEYTIFTWVDVPSDASITENRYDMAFQNKAWDVRLNSYSEYNTSGTTSFKIWDGSNEHQVFGNDIRGNGPTLLIATYDPSNGMKLYENDAEVGSNAWTGPPSNKGGVNVFWGGDVSGNQDVFERIIDHSCIFSVVLSSDERTALYDATKLSPNFFSQQSTADTSGGDTSGGDTSGGDTSGGDTSGGDTPGEDTSAITNARVRNPYLRPSALREPRVR